MTARHVARILGSLSIVSGVWLLCAPRAAGRAYGLPDRESLLRVLGLRDIGVGAVMTVPTTAAIGCALRAGADLVDLGLIVSELRNPSHERGLHLLRLLGALSLVAVSLETGRRLSVLHAGQPVST